MTQNVASTPLYLSGQLAPVPDEIHATDLPVTGAIPPELTGRYLRNGPNPLPGEDPGHWFAGHGMLHGVAISDGRAEWYRNRWIRTERLDGASAPTTQGRNLAMHPANTHIVAHGERLLALCEGGFPYQVTGTLDTIGPYDFDGHLRTSMTAHPKTDPVTGELFFFGYSARPPFLTFHVADAGGQLTHSEDVEVPGPTMMHDFAITEHYVVWLDLPVVFDLDKARQGAMPFDWNDAYGARLGVMPRTGGQVRWFDADPCYVFHVGNAREDSVGRVVVDAVRYSPDSFIPMWRGAGPIADPAATAAGAGVSVLHRWTIDLDTNRLSESQLDDRPIEFPSLNDLRVGRPQRFLYAVGSGGSGEIVKYDSVSGASEVHHVGPDIFVGEAVFVPAKGGTAEDDGWLMSIITPDGGAASSLIIVDAKAMSSRPIATVLLPRRVPAGFHGSWVADA